MSRRLVDWLWLLAGIEVGALHLVQTPVAAQLSVLVVTVSSGRCTTLETARGIPTASPSDEVSRRPGAAPRPCRPPDRRGLRVRVLRILLVVAGLFALVQVIVSVPGATPGS
ncbi:MAG: hypothetical protein HYX57_02830 [Chloroflexi bacterium]|nr:hypothetical protein [Chloroflexota bacterium]